MAYYLKKHHGRCPFWVLSHVITIGAIRDFYFILKPNDQDTIASIVLSLKIKHPARRLGAIIAFLADVRNMCAHDEPLIGFVHRRLDIGPFPEHDRLHIRRTAEGNPVSGRKDVLAILISIKYLVDQKNYSKFISLIVSDIAHLSSDLPFIKKQEILEAIGLCDNYQRLVEKF